MNRSVLGRRGDRVVGVSTSMDKRKSPTNYIRRISKSALPKSGESFMFTSNDSIFSQCDTSVSSDSTTEQNAWTSGGVVCSPIGHHRTGRLSSTASNDDMNGDFTYDSSDFDTSLEDSDDDELLPDNKDMYLRACRQYGVTASQSFARQIHDVAADVSYSMLASPDIKAICVALTKNYMIQSLDLSGNDLGPEGADYLTQCLQENIYVTCLYLTSTKLGPEGVRILMMFLKDNTTITTLDISDNRIPGKHAEVIGDSLEVNSHLRHLSLGYCCIDDMGSACISRALKYNMTLKVLDLRWNHLRTRGAVHICKLLEDNESLEVLNLSWNGLGVDGCEELMTSLKENRTLRELDLSCNRIDLKCLKLLMTGVTNNESLHTLKLGKNPLTTEGAITVLKSIHSTPGCHISTLDITGIPVDSEFSQVLEEVQADRDITVFHSENFHKYQVGNIGRQPSLKDYDPMMVLFEYMRQGNFRLIDFFRSLDTDNSNTISKKELRHVFKTLNTPLSERDLDDLMERLDIDENQEIDIEELRMSQKKNMRQLHTINKWSKQKSEDKFGQKLKNMVREAVEGRQRKGRDIWRKTAEKVKL